MGRREPALIVFVTGLDWPQPTLNGFDDFESDLSEYADVLAMTIFSEMIKCLGPAKFTRVSSEQLHGLDLPATSKSFLADIGVPICLPAASSALGIALSVSDGKLPRLNDYLHISHFESGRISSWRKWLRLGSSSEAHLCLAEHEGAVYRIEIADPNSADLAFVNSTIEQFVIFLFEYEVLALHSDTARSGSVQDTVSKFESKLRNIDEQAFEHGDAWWPTVVFEMKYGLG